MKKYKTWADFAKDYNLVLFNDCININDSAVLSEWFENHTCEYEQARQQLENCDCANNTCKKCDSIIKEYGDEPHCECETFQWYAIALNDYDMEYLNKTYNLDIFYSDTLNLYILPVYHYGTSWTHVNI